MVAKKIFLLLVCGFLITIGGVVYDVTFAGIPYQDPTPEVLAKFNFHSTIATSIEILGLVIIVVGIVLLLLKLLGFFKSEKPLN